MKFKVIPQLAEEECGAACVSMVLNNYFKKNVSLCEVRPIIKNTQAGTSFGDMKIGLERLGINSTIYKAEKNQFAFFEMSLPIITQIHKDDDTYHYIVIYKCTKTHIYYADPEYPSTKKIKISEFIPQWVPYIIQIDVNTSQVKLNIEDNLEKLNYFNLFSMIKGRVLLVVVLSLVVYALGLLLASMYNSYFNVLIPQKLYSILFFVMGFYLIISIVKFGMNLLTTLTTNSLNKSVDTILSNEFFNTLFHKPAASLEYFGIGETIATLSNIVLIRERFFTCLVYLPLNCAWLIISFILLARVNLYLSILVLVLIILLSLVVVYSNDKYQLFSRQLLQSNKSFNDTVIDIFSNTKMIKEYQQEAEFVNRGQTNLQENILARNTLLNFDAKLSGVKQTILESFNIVLFAVGAFLILKDKFTIGALLTYNSIIGFAINPLTSLMSVQSTLTQGKAAQELLFNFLSSKLNLFGYETFPTSFERPQIEFDKVNFSFDSRHTLLQDINLKIYDTKNIAITGSNGSGKTTLGKLIARHYVPDSGYIKINGRHLNAINESDFYKNILFVDSEEGIISSTILDNILLGRNVDYKRVEDLSSKLGLNEFVNKLEKGYNTPIGKSGVNLSLGQTQLVKIVRATIEEKSIYIFDEITNGLDTEHKQEAIKFLLDLPGLKFFITHDSELINYCDREIRIENINYQKEEIL